MGCCRCLLNLSSACCLSCCMASILRCFLSCPRTLQMISSQSQYLVLCLFLHADVLQLRSLTTEHWNASSMQAALPACTTSLSEAAIWRSLST